MALVKPDPITADQMAGLLKKAGRHVERAAKHPQYGNQALWEISHRIKDETARILAQETT